MSEAEDELRRLMAKSEVHVLYMGRSLCRVSRLFGVPGSWPEGHKWVNIMERAQATCETCRTLGDEIAAETVGNLR